MTHDPLCPAPVCKDKCFACDWCLQGCKCAEYARVREDERAKAVWQRDRLWGDGYAAALRDAVEAVNGLPFLQYDRPAGVVTDAGIASFTGQYVNRDDALAAIEALGGER